MRRRDSYCRNIWDIILKDTHKDISRYEKAAGENPAAFFIQ